MGKEWRKEDNLTHINDRPNHKELCAKGGTTTGIRKRKLKTMREALQAVLGSAIDDDQVKRVAEVLGVDADRRLKMMLAAMEKADKGDVEALRFVRDTAGEKPSDRVEIGGPDGQPISTVDLAALTDDQLKALVTEAD